jgi:hypothetical protein
MATLAHMGTLYHPKTKVTKFTKFTGLFLRTDFWIAPGLFFFGLQRVQTFTFSSLTFG